MELVLGAVGCWVRRRFGVGSGFVELVYVYELGMIIISCFFFFSRKTHFLVHSAQVVNVSMSVSLKVVRHWLGCV